MPKLQEMKDGPAKRTCEKVIRDLVNEMEEEMDLTPRQLFQVEMLMRKRGIKPKEDTGLSWSSYVAPHATKP